MRAADVPLADDVAWTALRGLLPADGVPEEAVRVARGRARVAHLLATDPGGAWVATPDEDDGVIGVALALVREGVWGLSLLAVHPDHHATGIGGRLLHAALETFAGCSGGIILSSQHPAAMRSYARAGFALRPSVSVAGIVRRDTLPAGLRSRRADPDDPEVRATIDRASRHCRGATHADDVRVACAALGQHLLVCEDRGFALVRDGSVTLLAALDDGAATDLLQTSWADGPRGATVYLEFLTAGQDWAIRAALDAGLALSPEGPVFTRGRVGAFAPYVPSGAFL